jgi:hypothetical protein
VRRPRKRTVIVGLVAALLGFFVLRLTVFETRYDVPSIAATPSYQDPALLERAWNLPVASTYRHSVVSQTNASVCGPSSLANVFRSIDGPATTQDLVLAGTGKCRTGLCIMGLTLDEVAEVARQKTPRSVRVHRDFDLAAFRALLRRANDPARRFVVNFNRGLLFGKGHGHHSPIAGYMEPEDLVFVLDVNANFGPWLVYERAALRGGRFGRRLERKEARPPRDRVILKG